ncbi:MAG: hypothetical protein EXS17_00820 [Phycisphaerales bacterium]|nr:hypothetical protein [Phycisphaerales bacterium]
MTTLVLTLFTTLGFFLIIAGFRLLGLVAAFTGGVLGWCLGGFLHDSLVTEWPPTLCAATASVIGAAIAALFVRPAVALGFGVAGTIIGLLLGGVLVERGIAPTAPLATSTPALKIDREPLPAASVRAARSGLAQSILTILDDAIPTAEPSARLTTLAGAGSRIATLVKSRWKLVPQATQTFLTAMTGGGAIVGLGIGLLFSRWALAGASSALGSLLLLGCGMPVLESLVPSFRCPESASAWLFLGAATTLAGWAFQMRRVQERTESPTPAS